MSVGHCGANTWYNNQISSGRVSVCKRQKALWTANMSAYMISPIGNCSFNFVYGPYFEVEPHVPFEGWGARLAEKGRPRDLGPLGFEPGPRKLPKK
jgi:hypothetical protein